MQWLADIGEGVPCARVLAVDDRFLTLERLTSAAPSRAAAHEFGARLARTHDGGADGFGAPPAGWTGPGFFGPLRQPLPMEYGSERSWGEFYADRRLAPMAEGADLDGATREAVDAVIRRCRAGDFDDDDVACRLHGDLWSGNVMWTPDGVVLFGSGYVGQTRAAAESACRI